MRELGYDLSSHKSKSLNELPDVEYDAVVTMGCGDECPFIRTRRHFDWNMPDSKDKSIDRVRTIRDLIDTQVRELVRTIRDEKSSK